MAAFFGFLFILALIVALALWFAARRQREQSGLPFNARIVYSDTGAWQKVEQPLFSRRHGLTGKPDYIVQDHGVRIPVEVKPNRTAAAPRESDVMQLAAYGLLLEQAREGGAASPYGLLKYRDAVFQIDFTPELREELLTLMEAMRCDLDAHEVERSHVVPQRCRACGYREECGQGLE